MEEVITAKKKSKRLLFEILAGVMCLTVGMIGGPYVKGMVGKVKETPVRSVTFHANLERIAVINLDTGVEKKGEQIYYAAKLIEYPDESYQTTCL